jgi:transcriptional regulator with XRE-family HTH domain
MTHRDRRPEGIVHDKTSREGDSTDATKTNCSRPLDDKEVADFVRIQRDANGWTQDTLAELSGLNVRTIQRVEDGQPSTLDTRRALARAFELGDIDFLSKPVPIPTQLEVERLTQERDRLQAERIKAEDRVAELDRRSRNAQMLLNMAAVRDVRWLHHIRMTLMPKQPSRVPFHNAAEIALRGYHCSMRDTPVLSRVTWSQLPYTEGGLHRGFEAGLIFTGTNFAPGITWACRFKGAPKGAPDMSNLWRQPNIYWGDYLETSTHPDPDEGPLSWRAMEFAVRNPEGRTSAWVEFAYDFDDAKILSTMQQNLDAGMLLLVGNQAGAAVEPLRKAMTYARGLFGWGDERHRSIEVSWNRALDQATLDKLRFREGTMLRIVAGPHSGKSGIVQRILTRHLHAYVIGAEGEEPVQAADDQVIEYDSVG